MRSLAVAGFVALALIGFRLAFPGAFISAMTPFMRAGTAVTNATADLFAVFENAASLAHANEQLRAENDALASENRALSGKLRDLSALTGATDAGKGPAFFAGVLRAPPVAGYDTLIVSGGTDDGITRGMEAFGNANTPLGVVTSVTAHAARITLFSSPSMTVDGWVGDTHTALALTGTGGGTFRAVAPRAANIRAGDIVYAPGPGALPIGVVSGIGGDPSAPNVTAYIRPATNPFSLTWVLLRDTGSALASAAACASSTLP